MLSDVAIENAKRRVRYSLAPHHQHNDCIRIAYQWLDAQIRRKTQSKKYYDLRELIRKWAGRYVTTSDIEVAASMHPEIHGNYPYFNISARLTEPSTERLKRVSEAFQHSYREGHDSSIYKIREQRS